VGVIVKKMYALHEFWSGFGWKAYSNYSVPDRAELPDRYITYEASADDFGHEIAQTAMLYHRSPSWEDITTEEELIADAIGRGGKMIPFEGGAFWIRKGNPWAQRMDEANDDSIRVIALNYTIEYLD